MFRCVVTIDYSGVDDNDQVEVSGPGTWKPLGCPPGQHQCTIGFEQVPPEQICGFTLQARHGDQVSEPSAPFCVPGEATPAFMRGADGRDQHEAQGVGAIAIRTALILVTLTVIVLG
jgi:hypothetical protein